MERKKFSPDDIMALLDKHDSVHTDPFFTSKILHLHAIEQKGKMLSNRMKLSMFGCAMLLIIIVNSVAFVKQYQSVESASNSRLVTVQQLSSVYFSNNE